MNPFENELKIYRSALKMDALFSRAQRRFFVRALLIVLLCIIAVILAPSLIQPFSFSTLKMWQLFQTTWPLGGLFFLFLPLTIFFSALSFFYNTLYFRGLESVMHEDLSDQNGITLEVASVVTLIPKDLTQSFLRSPSGRRLMLRLGVFPQDIITFLRSPRTSLTYEQMALTEHGFTTICDIAFFIFTHDTFFADFLFKHKVHEALYRGAVEWIDRDITSLKRHAHWWSRDHLGRIRGLGQDFSFGIAYSLKHYIRSIQGTGMFSHEGHDAAYAAEILTKIEATLARDKSANVLLVSEPGMGDTEIIAALAEKIFEGESVSSVIGKNVILFDDDAYIAGHNTKQAFELSFLKLMVEAERAGNIIMVIENIADFIKSAESLDIDIDDLFDRFLESDSLQFIVTSDPQRYRAELETRPAFLKHFAPIRMEHPSLESTVRVLEDMLLTHEYRHKIFFTYPSVMRIAESAERYIIDGVMPDKALSLLAEVAMRAESERVSLVTPDLVDATVRDKTNIAVGAIMEHERTLLLHLEEKLHERIVGQDDAVNAIARTMRRGRTNIQDPSRPIGSFLFLGSTGVGKTETAKALAYVFFGSEDRMERFDMSEYSDAHGLSRLIGEAGVGTLSTALREHPYGVLLLDEFEKASPEVRDLFLQILDEGIFTDAQSKKVNARNSIIIATSNAGSDTIREITKAGKKPNGAKEQIIDSIIKNHVFKPELINRFDSVVIFESLNPKAQEKIARFMLAELAHRIKSRGYQLVMDESVVAFLVREGYDPVFGARPMRRAIQDIIEEKIAERILENGLEPGETITLGKQDFGEAK